MPKNDTPPRWEEYLRKGVYTVGKVVEKAIGEAEKLKANISKSANQTQPVLSLEGQISIPKLKEIINGGADRIIRASVPSLVDKVALEIRDGKGYIVEKFQERGASIAVHVDMGGGSGSYEVAGKSRFSIRSTIAKLPFEDSFFDYAAAIVANQYQGDITKAISEIARLLTIGGEGIIVDFHPFGLYAKRGAARMRPAESTIRGLEDYYKICKAAALKLMEVREVFIDENFRGMFVAEDEKTAYRIVKGTPLLICLFVKKGK